MGKFDGLVGKFVIVILLFVALFSLIIIGQDENNSVQPAKEDQTFNDTFSSLIQTTEESSNNAEEKYDVFNSEEPSQGIGSINLFSIVSVGKSFSQSIFQIFGAVIKFPLIILGIEANIYNLMLVRLIIATIVAAWLLYKLGG